MRLDPRSRSWWLAGGVALVAVPLMGCGAPDEPLSRTTSRLDSYIFKRQQDPLIPSGVQPFDEFGTAVGVSSRWAVVGSPAADFDPSESFDNTGNATVFERKQGNAWKEHSTLRPEQSWPDARFGSTVASTDSLLVLGAPEADPSNVGLLPYGGLVAPFAYRDGHWVAEPLLHDPAESEERLFGSALAMDDRTLLVGSYWTDQVHAFPRTADGWGEPFTIESPLEPGAYFGFAVAVDDPYAFVGAPHASGKGNQAAFEQGAVFIFKRDAAGAWINQGEIERNFSNANDLFGAAIAARNGLVVASAFGDGSATFLKRDAASNWGDPFTVAAGAAASDSGFGWSLAIGARSSVWIGAYLDGNPNGAVYPYVQVEEGKWQDQPSVSFEEAGWFGYSVASASGALMVGAPAAGDLSQGAVYVIETSDGSTCTEDADCFSTHCVAGICCNSTCDQSCFSCLSAEKASKSADGTCEPKRAGSPDEACRDEGAQSCGTNGVCDGKGSCETYPVGTQCGEPFCTENEVVGAATCDAAGNCHVPDPAGCGNFNCSDSACQGICRSDAECNELAYCNDDGRCRQQLGIGAVCDSDEECLAGHCADGVCCDRACDGQCEACAEPGSVGRCLPLGAGSPPRVDPTAKTSPSETCAQLYCDGSDGRIALAADSSIVCAPAGCVDGSEIGEGRCNGEGGCEAPLLKSCEAYACGTAEAATGRPAQCATSCETVSDCAPDFYCTTDHECRPIEPSQPTSRGCSVSATALANDWSCIALLTSAITLIGLRRRRPQARNPSVK
jgi:hypothetical protein